MNRYNLLIILMLAYFPLTGNLRAVDYRNVKYKEITISTPQYLIRKSEEWENKSRIVGEIKDAPENFTIEFCRSDLVNLPKKTETHIGKLFVYETEWLTPGTYTMIVKAEGYMDQELKDIKIKAKTDCIINLVFGKITYTR